MAEVLRVVSTDLGDTWRVERADGTRVFFTIRLHFSPSLYSSYYFLLVDGSLHEEGRFMFDVWSENAARDLVRDLLTDIVHQECPGAHVTVVGPVRRGRTTGILEGNRARRVGQ